MNRKKAAIAGIILLLISGAVCADVLKQKITWAPETLSLPSLKPGQSTTTSAVFTNSSLRSNQKIQGKHLAFRITNGTGTVIKATANFPKQILPGQKVAVTFNISVASSTSAVPPRTISGKVQLVSNGEDGVKIFEKALGVNIAVSSSTLPPFPGATQDQATIAGIDSNANGVPDRAEWFIAGAAPDSAKKRGAMMLDAKTQQSFLLDHLAHLGENPLDPIVRARVKAVDIFRLRARHCEEYVFGVGSFYLFRNSGGREAWDAYTSVTQNLEALFYNTPNRLRNFKDAERPLVATGDNGVQPDQYKQECLALGFDPDSLSN